MALLDHHMHSKISFDSKEDLEEYLILSDNPIITTEHLDFKDPSGNFIDRIPDYDQHLEWANTLNQRYNNRVHIGLEIGWTHDSHHEITHFLKGKCYDLILLSVHQNGVADYLEKDKFHNLDKRRLIVEYLSDLKDAVSAMKDDVHVLTHFDYGFRVHDISVTDLEQYGKTYIEDIFRIIIENNIALEMNTSSMYKHGKLSLYEWALPIYQSLGGSLIVLGSDAHSKHEYKRSFDKAISFLKGNGFNQVVQLYSNNKGIVFI